MTRFFAGPSLSPVTAAHRAPLLAGPPTAAALPVCFLEFGQSGVGEREEGADK
ncbi:hypothetical protein ACP4OV_011989 [Aristida adscensionis]